MAPIPIKQLCRNLERINSVRTWLQNLTKIEKSPRINSGREALVSVLVVKLSAVIIAN